MPSGEATSGHPLRATRHFTVVHRRPYRCGCGAHAGRGGRGERGGHGGGAEGDLAAEFVGKAFAQLDRLAVVHLFGRAHETFGVLEIILGEALHADEKTAGIAIAAGEAFDEAVQCAPAAQVEVADGKIGCCRASQNILQGGKQVFIDVVVDVGHGKGALSYGVCTPRWKRGCVQTARQYLRRWRLRRPEPERKRQSSALGAL